MPLYEFKKGENFEAIEQTSLGKEEILERDDLQQLLKNQIDIIDEDLLVIAEKYSNFSDSGRRIDLLAIDKKANLVVIELKRYNGGYMELQAIRYAAFVYTESESIALDFFLLYKVIPSPKKERNVCYFYNKKESDGQLRMVSYHYNKDDNYIDRFEYIKQVISFLTHKSESMFD